MALARVGPLSGGVSRWLRNVRGWCRRACRCRLRRLRTIGDRRVRCRRCGDRGRLYGDGLGLDCWRCLDYRGFRDGLDGHTTPAPAAFSAGDGLGFHFRWRRGGSRSAASARRSWWSCNTRALLTLPSGADAGNLIIAQRTEMAAHGNVHLTKEIDHLVAGDPEFARQIMYSKLAQPISSLRPSGIGVRLSA